MIKKLKTKFVCINMAIITVVLFVIFGMVINSTAKGLERDSIAIMQMASGNSFLPVNPDEIPEEIRIPYFTVNISKSGVVTAKNGNFFDLSDQKKFEEIVDTAFYSNEKTGILRNHNLRFLKEETPNGTTIVFADISSEQAVWQTLLKTALQSEL